MPPNRPQEKTPPQSAGPETMVEVSAPAVIQIRLVQGNELRHYEIFFSLASLALSTAVGFWTAYIGERENAFFWSAVAFTGLAILAAAFAAYYRSKISNGSVRKVMPLDSFKSR